VEGPKGGLGGWLWGGWVFVGGGGGVWGVWGEEKEGTRESWGCKRWGELVGGGEWRDTAEMKGVFGVCPMWVAEGQQHGEEQEQRSRSKGKGGVMEGGKGNRGSPEGGEAWRKGECDRFEPRISPKRGIRRGGRDVVIWKMR